MERANERMHWKKCTKCGGKIWEHRPSSHICSDLNNNIPDGSIITFSYKNYIKVRSQIASITDLMLSVAELTIFEKQKKFPNKLEESKSEIRSLKSSIINGEYIPPVLIEIDENNNFQTIVDGMHRIIAYRESGRTNCMMIELRRT